MIKINKTSNVVTLGRKESAKSAGSSKISGAEMLSPFAAKPLDALKAITERRSRPLTEEQKLALLQKALHPFATEARNHLPLALSRMEKTIRKKMIEEGFSSEVATEAGDETVSVLLSNKITHKKSA